MGKKKSYFTWENCPISCKFDYFSLFFYQISFLFAHFQGIFAGTSLFQVKKSYFTWEIFRFFCRNSLRGNNLFLYIIQSQTVFDNFKKVIFYVGKIIKISLKKVDFSSYGSEFFSLVNKFRHKVDRILIFISFSTQKSHILRGKIAKICLFLVHFFYNHGKISRFLVKLEGVNRKNGSKKGKNHEK